MFDILGNMQICCLEWMHYLQARDKILVLEVFQFVVLSCIEQSYLSRPCGEQKRRKVLTEIQSQPESFPLRRIYCVSMSTGFTGKTFFWLGTLKLEQLGKSENHGTWVVELTSYDAETLQMKVIVLMVRNFYQNHVLLDNCIISFALPCHSNTENSCQRVV